MNNLKKYSLLFYNIFQLFWTSGVVFGWSALQVLLWNEGIYSDLCDTTDPEQQIPCDKQNLKLELIYICGYFANVSSGLINGIIMDKFGPRAANLFGLFLQISGAILFAISCNKQYDAFIPAYILLGFGGSAVEISAFHVSNLFPKYRGTVISLLTSGFGASSIVFRILLMIANGTGLTCYQLFLYYAALLGAFFVISAIIGVNNSYELEEETQNSKKILIKQQKIYLWYEKKNPLKNNYFQRISLCYVFL